jgi:polysaccharide export outer membrane protein
MEIGAMQFSWRAGLQVFTACFLLAAAPACYTADVGRYEDQALKLTPPPDLRATELSAGDVFEVRVYNEEKLSGIHRVSGEGTIDFPLIGSVTVQGMSPPEVAAELTSRLRDGFLRNPYVTVYVKEYNSKKVFVMGQVAKPGTFPYQDSMNVIQAITLAGGFTELASRDQTVVTRIVDGKEVRISVPVEQISVGLTTNFALQPGDIIYVPESVL